MVEGTGQSTRLSDGNDVDRDETLMKMHNQLQQQSREKQSYKQEYYCQKWETGSRQKKFIH